MKRAVLSMEVFKWPEYQALCDKLGVDYTLPTTEIIITLRQNEVVEVRHTYYAADMTLDTVTSTVIKED